MVQNREAVDVDLSKNSRDWNKAVSAFESGDLAGALFTFKKIARSRPSALVEIGNIYEFGGRGVVQDYLEAKRWYEKSIDTIGDPKAHLALGRLWFFGLGVEQNFERSLYHFGLIEDMAEPGALYALGIIYRDGLAVSKDAQRAHAYFLRSMELGHLLGRREVGRFKIRNGELLSGLMLFAGSVLKIFISVLQDPGDARVRI